MGHLWSFLTALTANWELHIWHPWDTMAGTACSFDVQNPDPSCPSKRGKGPAVKLRGWDVDLWCLSSAPRWTAFLQSVFVSSCPRSLIFGVDVKTSQHSYWRTVPCCARFLLMKCTHFRTEDYLRIRNAKEAAIFQLRAWQVYCHRNCIIVCYYRAFNCI